MQGDRILAKFPIACLWTERGLSPNCMQIKNENEANIQPSYLSSLVNEGSLFEKKENIIFLRHKVGDQEWASYTVATSAPRSQSVRHAYFEFIVFSSKLKAREYGQHFSTYQDPNIVVLKVETHCCALPLL